MSDNSKIQWTEAKVARFMDKFSGGPEDICWEWGATKNYKGYGQIRIDTVSYMAHRVSFSLYYKKEIPTGFVVCHRCDNPSCVNPHHLFIGTYKDNSNDMVSKGRNFVPKYLLLGEERVNSILKDAEVLAIRVMYPNDTMQKLADQYKVSIATIYNIIKRKTWRHI